MNNQKLVSLIKDLGKEIKKIKLRGKNLSLKKDMSPISEADKLVNFELIKFLEKTQFRNIISEESKNLKYIHRKNWEYFWLIDPIDGTKEFINHGTDYTINVALCKKNRPIFSIVNAPSRNELYMAEKGQGAFKNNRKINITNKIKGNIKIVASKSHLNKKTSDFISTISTNKDVQIKRYGSSLKICKIAEGKADIYPRFGTTMEWDTCAAELILDEAGGSIKTISGAHLSYNKRSLKNPFFIASSNLEP